MISSDAPRTGRREDYLKIADNLISQFRDPKGADPRVFLTAIVTVLMHYPLEVAARAADPFTGLPSLQPWIPTPYDVKQFLESQMAFSRNKIAWEARSRAQLEERAGIEAQRKVPKQTVQEVGDEMAQRGVFLPGYIKGVGHVPGVATETPKSVCAKFGLSQAQWDALPDDTVRGGAKYVDPLTTTPRRSVTWKEAMALADRAEVKLPVKAQGEL